MPGVFLSYSRQDEAVARSIVEHLRKAGIEVWSDAWVTPGANIAATLGEHIDQADTVLVLLSREAASSEWVRMEAAAAVAAESRDPEKRLIPVILEKGVDVPFLLRNYRFVDLSDPRERDTVLSELANTLARPSVAVDKVAERKAALETVLSAERVERGTFSGRLARIEQEDQRPTNLWEFLELATSDQSRTRALMQLIRLTSLIIVLPMVLAVSVAVAVISLDFRLVLYIAGVSFSTVVTALAVRYVTARHVRERG